MQRIAAVVIALCLLQGAVSQSVCSDGLFASTGGSDPDKGKCTTCSPLCKTCSSSTTCDTYIDKVKGLTSGTPICGTVVGTTMGYNSAKDTCDRCMDGCFRCNIDYNICSICKTGWDLDRDGAQCIRASLGLAAVVLALSVLTLLIVIITCICACKL